ncbi:MAG: hypothetical protein IJ711_08325 [Lachnospiraceae bacterium]|nr:hypothetical protein [Lachnospiraceae bacterium]
MREHRKKMIAPILITVLVIIYYMTYFGFLIAAVESGAAKLLLGIVPLLLAGVMIYVCRQRIEEIRSGEEDDLSKY